MRDLCISLEQSEDVISSDEVARASASDVSRESNRPGKNYWKGLLESLRYKR